MSILFRGSFFLLTAVKLDSNEAGQLNGYTDVVPFRGRYIAIGSDGRIDSISRTGDKTTVDHSCRDKLNSAFSNDSILIVAGEQGTILSSFDGQKFNRAESGTDRNIQGITSRNGLIIAGSESGTVLVSANGKSWSPVQTRAKGDILSVSSNHSFFIGVTNAGEILKSKDGINWEIKDYNKVYAGYNPHAKFKKILAVQNSIVIIGIHEDGSPSILFSSLGNVWAESLPVYYDDKGMLCYLTNKPNGITYDSQSDQFFLACDNGTIFKLSNCAKCNKYFKISKCDLNALVYADNFLVIAGADYSVFVRKP